MRLCPYQSVGNQDQTMIEKEICTGTVTGDSSKERFSRRNSRDPDRIVFSLSLLCFASASAVTMRLRWAESDCMPVAFIAFALFLAKPDCKTPEAKNSLSLRTPRRPCAALPPLRAAPLKIS